MRNIPYKHCSQDVWQKCIFGTKAAHVFSDWWASSPCRVWSETPTLSLHIGDPNPPNCPHPCRRQIVNVLLHGPPNSYLRSGIVVFLTVSVSKVWSTWMEDHVRNQIQPSQLFTELCGHHSFPKAGKKHSCTTQAVRFNYTREMLGVVLMHFNNCTCRWGNNCLIPCSRPTKVTV